MSGEGRAKSWDWTSVELALAFEGEFGVAIYNAAAKWIRTPRDGIECQAAAQDRGPFLWPQPPSRTLWHDLA